MSPRHTLAAVSAAILIAGCRAEPCADPADTGSCNAQTEDAKDVHMSLLQTALEVSKAAALEEHQVHHPKALTVPPPAAKLTAENWHPPANRAEAAGVSMNAEGDIDVFISGFITNAVMVTACIGIFALLKDRYPMMFANNLQTNTAPLNEVPEGKFGWFKASWAAQTEDITDNVGLDMAMMVMYCDLGMRVFATIGIPMFFVMGPINWAFGGGRAGNDRLSYLSFGNVVDGSQLYWIHSLIVWGVVVTVRNSAFKYQEIFLKHRFRWLRSLPATRAKTILVEGIPADYQSDAKLKEFFEKLFGSGSVAKTYVVRDAPELEAACAERESLNHELDMTRLQAKDEATDPDKRQELLNEVRRIETDLRSKNSEIKSMQQDVKKKSSQLGADGCNADAGFVTFKKESDTAFALSVQYGEDLDEWQVSVPPDPSSVLWRDLQQGSSKGGMYTLMGYAFTGGLFFLYMPSVIWITQIATKINLGPLQSVWAALAPTIGLQVMVAMLPTFLIMIFRSFFTLKADVFAQLMLQNWYFIFQIVFVVLVTAIGGSVGEFFRTLAETPFKVFSLFGSTMPMATHFYMNFIMLQWATHVMVMLRYVQLGKYILARRKHDEETAVAMAEPEDQDFYGMGSRASRMSIVSTVGLVYGTLSPPVNMLTLIEFAICRAVYGYLLPFAETKKPDTGGYFWVQQLRNLFTACVIYCIVMTGVFMGRSDSSGPVAISAAALIYVIISSRAFERKYLWEKLPLKEMTVESKVKKKDDTGLYVQQWLQD